MSIFKIQLANGEFYKNNSGRVQHYKSNEKAAAKIERLGDIASDAKAIECEGKKAKAVVIKTEKSKKAMKTRIKP